MLQKKNWKIDAEQILGEGPVVPVMVIHRLEHAVPMARALVAGGVRVLEITLRTPVAIEAIRVISEGVPAATVGAGTVTNAGELKAVEEAGALFAISPGLTPELLEAANRGGIALIPGVSTISELMTGIDKGYTHFKFFPAEAAGGVKTLKAFAGPFPAIRFCPTGGITPETCNDYMALPNVMCVGGSWLVPSDAVENERWGEVTAIAKEAVQKARRSS
jgi:2-dehydro-3-deoxyphosphogluconate aldolase/(4S)-4-hydroxy-2-oxoglutarate aldolase